MRPFFMLSFKRWFEFGHQALILVLSPFVNGINRK